MELFTYRYMGHSMSSGIGKRLVCLYLCSSLIPYSSLLPIPLSLPHLPFFTHFLSSCSPLISLIFPPHSLSPSLFPLSLSLIFPLSLLSPLPMSFLAHSHRTEEEIKCVRETRDPHKIAEQLALEHNLMTPEEIKVLHKAMIMFHHTTPVFNISLPPFHLSSHSYLHFYHPYISLPSLLSILVLSSLFSPLPVSLLAHSHRTEEEIKYVLETHDPHKIAEQLALEHSLMTPERIKVLHKAMIMFHHCV